MFCFSDLLHDGDEDRDISLGVEHHHVAGPVLCPGNSVERSFRSDLFPASGRSVDGLELLSALGLEKRGDPPESRIIQLDEIGSFLCSEEDHLLTVLTGIDLCGDIPAAVCRTAYRLYLERQETLYA